MKRVLTTIGLIAFCWQAQAYIPSSKMILERVAENAAKAPLFLEQEVTLVSGEQNITVKEQWLFDGDSSIRLIVRGEKELKDQIVFQNLYTDNQKTTTLSGILQTSRQPKGLLEKLFFMKTTDELRRFLLKEGIVGEEINYSTNFKKMPGGKFLYTPESFLRLGRIGGGVAYVFGPAARNEGSNPGLWIEQDQFHILKVRTTNGEELRAERPTTFSRGARWPKELNYTWGAAGSSSQAQVQVTSARVAEGPQRQIFQKHTDIRTSEFERHRGKYLLEEFYQKFR